MGRGHWAKVTKVGRGHHFFNFYEWSELEKVTRESNVNRLGREEKSGPRSLGRDHQSGPRSLGRDQRGPRSHVSVTKAPRSLRSYSKTTTLASCQVSHSF